MGSDRFKSCPLYRELVLVLSPRLKNGYTEGHINTGNNMDALLSSDDTLLQLWTFCSRLDFNGRKALVALARSQTIPDPDTSPILFSKVKCVLDLITLRPPFECISTTPLSEIGELLHRLIQTPILTGLVIVFSLGVGLDRDEIERCKKESFSKELRATQTVRRQSVWDWDTLLDPYVNIRGRKTNISGLSPLQLSFSTPLSRFRTTMKNRIVPPHYSRRGISSESASLLRSRVNKRGFHYGSSLSFHSNLDKTRVTSRDLVHHYIRTGDWIPGRTEMKQRWYPSGLLPRTYFSWGGTAVSISSYLRNFFNDLADLFGPTHRENRVKPNWLYNPDLPNGGGFAFYDLTSFTSWFHEQVPFLHALSRYFEGTTLNLVGPNLSLYEQDLGHLITAYIQWCNDFPEFIISSSLVQTEIHDTHTYLHQCAGFLGIPGNLVTCTLAHGLSLASHFSHEENLQIPGDDVGYSFRSEDQMVDVLRTAKTLGELQMDKVFRLPQVSLYLKRRVLDLGDSIDLAEMLIYPLLPYLLNPTSDKLPVSQFRLPERDQLMKRACSVLCSFHRDLWKMTKGSLSTQDSHTILSFLRGIHDMVGIPYGAIFQSRLYGDTGFELNNRTSGVTLKFPVDEDDCLYYNPETVFASRYVEEMRIRITSDVPVTRDLMHLTRGQVICVPKRRGWTFLEDMGYVRILGIPGGVATLIGVDAKTAFLNATEPNLREVEILSDLGVDKLIASNVLPSDTEAGEENISFGEVVRDLRSELPIRYMSYIDLDAPKERYRFDVQMEIEERRDPSSFRRSLSPDVFDDILDY